MNQEEIGKFISIKRKEKKLTQKELADKLNISEKTISKWETGNGLPEISNMQSLCEILDITITELLNGTESKKEDKVIEYIKYKDKHNKRVLLFSIITLLLIIIVLISSQLITYKNFYKTNYKQNQIYRLQGEGDNFSIFNTLVITSPYKTILVTPKITPKTNEIPEDNIVGYSIDYEDNLILSQGGPYTSLMPTIIEELNGYDEIFNKEKLDNLDKWTVTVFYIKDDERVSEKIKLNKEEIFNTDKYEKEEIEPIARPEDQPEQKDYTQLKEKLKQDGFEYKNDNFLVKETDKYILEYDFSTGTINYIYDKTSPINHCAIYIVGIYDNNKNSVIKFQIGRGDYYIETKKWECSSNDCEKNGPKIAIEFLKLIEKYNN